MYNEINQQEGCPFQLVIFTGFPDGIQLSMMGMKFGVWSEV